MDILKTKLMETMTIIGNKWRQCPAKWLLISPRLLCTLLFPPFFILSFIFAIHVSHIDIYHFILLHILIYVLQRIQIIRMERPVAKHLYCKQWHYFANCLNHPEGRRIADRHELFFFKWSISSGLPPFVWMRVQQKTLFLQVIHILPKGQYCAKTTLRYNIFLQMIWIIQMCCLMQRGRPSTIVFVNDQIIRMA